MTRVFVSYASVDVDRARHVCDELRAASFDVWIDFERIGRRDDWRHAVREAMATCSRFAAVMSEAYDESEQCSFELDLAERLGLPVDRR